MSCLPRITRFARFARTSRQAYARLSDAFETNYGTTGNVSVPSAVLLRAWLLMALYSIRSERALCEQIGMNAGFRWFVGLDWDDEVFDHSTLSKNRKRIFGSGAAEALLGEVVRIAQSRRLLSRLMRKGYGQESMLCHLGHILVDSASGLVRACKVTKACGLGGNAEVIAALEMADEHMGPGQTLVADRGYDEDRFVGGLRKMGIRAHPRAKKKYSSLDGRTTKRVSYEQSLKRRYIPEPVFGWIKNRGRMRQTMLRGTDKVGWQFHLYCMAYNLRRMERAASS